MILLGWVLSVILNESFHPLNVFGCLSLSNKPFHLWNNTLIEWGSLLSIMMPLLRRTYHTILPENQKLSETSYIYIYIYPPPPSMCGWCWY